MSPPHAPGRRPGFTVIELLVVLAAIALLVSVAAPRYVQHLDRAREVALKDQLRATRLAIDQFWADHGRYPDDLQELVARRYLNRLPIDPLNEDSATAWNVTPPPPGRHGRLYDLHSAAPGTAPDGTPYASW